MNDISWEDIRLFILVARAGGLNGAAKSGQTSPATLGRRMLSLERQTGRNLFIRRQTGYALTEDGRQLLDIVVSMEAGSRSINNWLSSAHQLPKVRISAGTWTSEFLCENFARLWSVEDRFHLAFEATEKRLDIAHREVDIGLRNKQPEEISLASQKIGRVAMGAFCARNADKASRKRWIGLTSDRHQTSSMRWLADNKVDVVAWANTPRTCYGMMNAGIGVGIIPCFAGDRDPALERVADPIVELEQNQWLVMHDESRDQPEIRTVLDRLSALLMDHAELFAGQRPLGG